MSEWNENVISRRFGEKHSSDGVRAVDEVTDLWHPMASARPPLCYEERWWPQAQIQETTGEAASADVLSSGIVMKYVPAAALHFSHWPSSSKLLRPHHSIWMSLI